MKESEMESIKIQLADPIWGAQMGEGTLKVHNRARCEGEFCSIHNPSDHALKDAPRNWRSDIGLMERLCEHGIGHPDPDGLAYEERMMPGSNEWRGIHGCDGCC